MGNELGHNLTPPPVANRNYAVAASTTFGILRAGSGIHSEDIASASGRIAVGVKRSPEPPATVGLIAESCGNRFALLIDDIQFPAMQRFGHGARLNTRTNQPLEQRFGVIAADLQAFIGENLTVTQYRIVAQFAARLHQPRAAAFVCFRVNCQPLGVFRVHPPIDIELLDGRITKDCTERMVQVADTGHVEDTRRELRHGADNLVQLLRMRRFVPERGVPAFGATGTT